MHLMCNQQCGSSAMPKSMQAQAKSSVTVHIKHLSEEKSVVSGVHHGMDVGTRKDIKLC